MSRHEIALTVNGCRHTAQVEARVTLVDFLRDHLRLTGTHTGCEHGVCGACSILLNGKPVRSCLIFAVQAADADIVTVEGLAPDPETLDRKSTRLNSSHTVIYTLSLHDALPIYPPERQAGALLPDLRGAGCGCRHRHR